MEKVCRSSIELCCHHECTSTQCWQLSNCDACSQMNTCTNVPCLYNYACNWIMLVMPSPTQFCLLDKVHKACKLEVKVKNKTGKSTRVSQQYMLHHWLMHECVHCLCQSTTAHFPLAVISNTRITKKVCKLVIHDPFSMTQIAWILWVRPQ